MQSWLHALKDDPSYLFKAAAGADKASAYIMEHYESALEGQKDAIEHTQERVSLKGEAVAVRDASRATASSRPFESNRSMALAL